MALLVVVVVVILNPPLPEVPAVLASSESPATPSTALPPASSEATPATSAPTGSTRRERVSTVQLPEAAIHATSEQLQQESETVAKRLQQAYPDLPQALHVAAMLASRTRHSEEAERLWARCIELAPKQVAYYVNLAAAAMERGDSQLAADTLHRAIDAGCVSPDVYHHLAVALTKLGQCEEAEQTVGKALSLYPGSHAFDLVLGQAQLKLGKLPEAETNLRRAIASGSATPTAYFALGNACARQGKKEDAAKYRKIFTEMKTETPLDKQRRFEILTEAEARQTAITILCEAALVHAQQKNSLESERLLLRAVAIDPASSVPCRLLAEIYENAGMVAEARVVWTRLLEIEPYAADNYLALAHADARLDEPEAAEATLKLLVTILPEAADGYAVLAQFYRDEGHTGKARWFAQEALRRQPSPEGYEFLATVCRMAGDQAAAEEALARARAMSEEMPVNANLNPGNENPQDPDIPSTVERGP